MGSPLWAWRGRTACSGDGGGTVWSSWPWSWGRPKEAQHGPRRPNQVQLTSATASQETPELFLPSLQSSSTSPKVPPPLSANSPSPPTSTPFQLRRCLARFFMNLRPQQQQQQQLQSERQQRPQRSRTLPTPGLSTPLLMGHFTTLTQPFLSTHPRTP